jgi:hypothetical protein
LYENNSSKNKFFVAHKLKNLQMNVMNSIQKHILEMKKLVIPHAPLGVKVATDVHWYQPTEQFSHLVM